MALFISKTPSYKLKQIWQTTFKLVIYHFPPFSRLITPHRKIFQSKYFTKIKGNHEKLIRRVLSTK